MWKLEFDEDKNDKSEKMNDEEGMFLAVHIARKWEW